MRSRGRGSNISEFRVGMMSLENKDLATAWQFIAPHRSVAARKRLNAICIYGAPAHGHDPAPPPADLCSAQGLHPLHVPAPYCKKEGARIMG